MTLLESANEAMNIANAFDQSTRKIGIYMEASVEEYKINLDECELKVLKENGTYEDLAYLKEEAGNGLVERAKNAIQAIIKAFKEFISNIKDRVLSFFAKGGASDSIDEIEKKVKFNPFLKNKKGTYEDTQAEAKVCDAFLDKVHGLIAKIKSGKASKEEVEQVEDDYNMKSRAAAAAAVVTATVEAMIAKFHKVEKEIPKEIDSVDKETTEMLDGLCKGMDSDTAADVVEAAQAASRLSSRIAKDKAFHLSQAPAKILQGIRDVISKAKGGTKLTPPTDDKTVKESTDFMDDASYLQALHDQLFSESTKDDDDYTSDYMKEMEQMIFGGNI